MQADCQHAKITKPQKQDSVFLSEYDKTAEKWENKNPEIAQISRMLVCLSGFGRFCHVFHLPCGQKKACQAAEKKTKDSQQTKQRKFPCLLMPVLAVVSMMISVKTGAFAAQSGKKRANSGTQSKSAAIHGRMIGNFLFIF